MIAYKYFKFSVGPAFSCPSSSFSFSFPPPHSPSSSVKPTLSRWTHCWTLSGVFTMSTNEKVRCTYSACGHFFRSTKEMQSHKAYADHHYYCTKCDMDFGNHALLHLHKVMSEHHFACLECDMELRSQAGLRHHVKIVCFLLDQHDPTQPHDILRSNTDKSSFHVDTLTRQSSVLPWLRSPIQVRCRCHEAHRRTRMPCPLAARQASSRRWNGEHCRRTSHGIGYGLHYSPAPRRDQRR